MNHTLSPKELARVIGVSESSLKRWVDEGRLEAARTAGGHRRISIHEAVRFIRETGQAVARPELLGVALQRSADLLGSDPSIELAVQSALTEGQADRARALLVSHFLSTRSVVSVFDGVIANAMHRIGELWRHREDGIMIEHRATEICLESIRQVRLMMPPASSAAPVAIGSSAAGDPYRVPTLMAATTLLEVGFRDINLGADLPLEPLIVGVRQHRPRIVWVSYSIVRERSEIEREVARLAEACAEVDATLVLGGRGIYGIPIALPSATHLVGSMAELSTLGRAQLARESAKVVPRTRPIQV